MPVLVVLELGLDLILVILLYLAMQRAADAWLKPLLQWLFAPRQAFWKRVLLWPVHEIGRGLAAVYRYVVRILGGAYFLAAAGLGRWLHGYAAILQGLLSAAELFAAETLKALTYLKNVAVPAMIGTALRPVVQDISTLKAQATAAAAALTGISVEVAAGLRSLPWGVPLGLVPRVRAFFNAFEHLWDQVFAHIVPRLNLLQYTTIPRIAGRVEDIWDDIYRPGRDSLAGMRTRLRELERAIGNVGTETWFETGLLAALATIAGVTIAVARTGIRSLFCRNTRGVAQKLCGMDEALLAALLAGTLGFALLLDPKAVVRAGQAVEGTIEYGIRTMADL